MVVLHITFSKKSHFLNLWILVLYYMYFHASIIFLSYLSFLGVIFCKSANIEIRPEQPP